MDKSHITTSSLLQYGVLASPLAFAGFPLYVLAPDFFATNYGIQLSVLGIALLALRLFDAFQDPFIGLMSDRHRDYVASIMLMAAILLVLSVYGLFNLIFFSPVVWFVICMGLAVSAYSILVINLNALGALWSPEEKVQTRISAFRETFGLLGLISAVSLPGLLATVVPKNQIYQWFALTLMILMAIAFYIFNKWNQTQHQAKIAHNRTTVSVLKSLTSVSKNSKKLFLVYLFSMIASSTPAVLVVFFVRDLLGAEIYIGLFMLIYFLSGALFMPVWKSVSQRYGKYRSWLFGMLLAVVSFVWAFLLKKGDLWQYAVICLGSGSALGADLLFPNAILADQLHREKAENFVSTHYGLLALLSKASLALASALLYPILENFGFIPAADNSSGALFGLSVTYALIPCLIKCVAALLLWYMFIHSQKEVFGETN